MSPVKVVASVVAIAAVAAVGTTVGLRYERAGQAAARQAQAAVAPAHASLPSRSAPLIGAYVRGLPDSTAPLTRFEKLTGTRPRVAVYYSGWGEAFKTAFAEDVARMGAVPLVQIEPGRMSIASIANGSQDAYLVPYADAVRAYGHPVILSFAHEPNGTWYSWGYTHVRPATYVAAWRHIVNLFRAEGADNVTWLWTVNVLADMGRRATDPAPWWPGSRYVTWIGIDGYYRYPTETFGYLFDATLADIRKFSRKPILVAETGVAPVAGQAAKIPGLFAAVKADGLLGLIWFDSNGNRDWRIDSDPAARAAFGASARRYGYQGAGGG